MELDQLTSRIQKQANVLGESPDVGASAGGHLKSSDARLGFGVQEPKRINRPSPNLNLDRRLQWRDVVYHPRQLREDGLDLGPLHSTAEAQDTDVPLVDLEGPFCEFGRLPSKQGEQACGEGIQRPTVPQSADSE